MGTKPNRYGMIHEENRYKTSDARHDMHEPLRQSAIQNLGELSKAKTFGVSEILTCCLERHGHVIRYVYTYIHIHI
jgi:hypothetical protein